MTKFFDIKSLDIHLSLGFSHLDFERAERAMKQCYFCGKKQAVGFAVSHSHKKSKRRFLPNLINKNIVVGEKKIRVKVCTDCLKKIGK
jgi:large subunit ribosomal protein L28